MKNTHTIAERLQNKIAVFIAVDVYCLTNKLFTTVNELFSKLSYYKVTANKFKKRFIL